MRSFDFYTQEDNTCKTCGRLRGFTCRCYPSFYDSDDAEDDREEEAELEEEERFDLAKEIEKAEFYYGDR